MTQTGFWRQNQATNNVAALNTYGQINKVWYLFPQGGGPRGSFTTFAELAPNLRNRDLIYLSGVLREQAIAPLGVYDVTVLGAADQPRQATNSGVPTGGGATWLAPTSPTAETPLIEVREQGWTFNNIFFNGPEDDACIKMHCEETATYPDGSHLQVINCRFGGGFIGIEDYGGASNVLVTGCSFEALAGVGGGALVVTNQSIRIPQKYVFSNNRILPCVNGIVGAFVESVFQNNQIWKSTTTTVNLASGNTGLRNMVVLNFFNIAAADFDPAGGVTGNATDTWINYLSDTLEYGVPAN